jgi:hypothetical protein
LSKLYGIQARLSTKNGPLPGKCNSAEMVEELRRGKTFFSDNMTGSYSSLLHIFAQDCLDMRCRSSYTSTFKKEVMTPSYIASIINFGRTK